MLKTFSCVYWPSACPLRGEESVQCLCLFFNWVVFFVVELYEFLYILDFNFLTYILFVSIFSHFKHYFAAVVDGLFCCTKAF